MKHGNERSRDKVETARKHLKGFLRKASDLVDDEYGRRHGIHPRLAQVYPRVVTWAELARRGVW